MLKKRKRKFIWIFFLFKIKIFADLPLSLLVITIKIVWIHDEEHVASMRSTRLPTPLISAVPIRSGLFHEPTRRSKFN